MSICVFSYSMWSPPNAGYVSIYGILSSYYEQRKNAKEEEVEPLFSYRAHNKWVSAGKLVIHTQEPLLNLLAGICLSRMHSSPQSSFP